MMMRERREIIAGCYEAERDGLVAFAGRCLGSREQAEDMVHDAFVRLLTTDVMLTEATLPALVYTMVRNMVTDSFRRKACAAGYEGYVVHAGTGVDDTASLCSCHEIEAWLERGMARLPERCRIAYRLHVLGGMKIAEIQQATGEDYKRLEHSLGMARRQMRLYMKRFVG